MLLKAMDDHSWTQWAVLIMGLMGQVVSVLAGFITAWRITHSKTKYIKEQISCKKREIWSIQDKITSIALSGDLTMLTSEYIKQLVIRLKTLKQEISDLNAQLKPKDKDTTKLNVTESIKALQDKIKELGAKNNEKISN